MSLSSAPASSKNAHLKGRRRFRADLADIEEECSNEIIVEGYKLSKIQPGEDEGIIELAIFHIEKHHTMNLNLLISDTSDYPKSHIFFCSSADDGSFPELQCITESIASEVSRPIRETVEKILHSLSKPTNNFGSTEEHHSQDSEMDDDNSTSDFQEFDQFDDFTRDANFGVTNFNILKLQNHFVQTLAADYRPGLLNFADDDFAISASLPIVLLAKSIPPRALMAWDRRLLSRSQHLTLLISGFRGVYPALDSWGAYNALAQHSGSSISFKVGLTKKYKPGKEYAKDASRTFGLIISDAEDDYRSQIEKSAVVEDMGHECDAQPYADSVQLPAGEEDNEEGNFDKFSLSDALESLLDHALLKLIQLRRKFGLGWAGAELLFSEIEKTQTTEEYIYSTQQQQILAADKEEMLLAHTNNLPIDPVQDVGGDGEVNIILTSFCYLLRRLTLCPRYCIVCHDKLKTDFEALKPYVCDSKLCAYQYYTLNRGPSLEYEIVHNPMTVDLLVSFAHSAATEQVMDEPLPLGLGLRVPLPDASKVQEPPRPLIMAQPMSNHVPKYTRHDISPGPDGLCDFDDLSLPMMRAAVANLIDSLPAVDDMKKHLERKVKAGKAKPKLKDLDPTVLPAAWAILRWCIASCTAHLEEISSGEESIRNLDPGWRQFRFSVGSPDAEAKFKGAVLLAQQKSVQAVKFPSLYAFHGSPLRNWHSIIRHGLWYKTITHGRSFGNGVYLAKDGSVSMGAYAQPGRSSWRKSRICPTSCVAVAEIVNLPSEFVSNNPFYVIKDTHWIICRYLLVKTTTEPTYEGIGESTTRKPGDKSVPLVELDPAHPVTVNSTYIEIPDPTYRTESLLRDRQAEFFEEENDAEDITVFTASIPTPSNCITYNDANMSVDDSTDQSPNTVLDTSITKFAKTYDWKHDPHWVKKGIMSLLPPPLEASPIATVAVQRELKAILREQEFAKSLKELGWYMPPDLIGDNLFQWIVEMHSFDDELPIAIDLKAKKLNSIIFEIRFPPTFPNSPPFFRIVTPRFLPFIQGGGGHVTGGGSICMDLLTADGWLPTYSIAAVLLQVKLAISNLDPRPARLSADYDRPYGVQEALFGYKRAAATHGWQIPQDIDKLVRKASIPLRLMLQYIVS